jgi:hypothetical protein
VELRAQQASADEVEGFAEALAAHLRGEQQALVLWLRSRAAAWAGRPIEGEELARRALSTDAHYLPAIIESCWYADDRGRARDALNLLQLTAPPEDERIATLERRARLQAASVGRNEPCPCGSGRKFKHCHLGRVELPTYERLRWLLDKATCCLNELAHPELINDVLHSHCHREEAAHFFGNDVLLFEEGWLARFLEARGELLDDWEREAAARWLTEHVGSVFRVEAIDGDFYHLRDAADGVVRTVSSSPSLDVARQDRLVWCRLLPVGDGWYTSGAARNVGLAERDKLLGLAGADLDPVEKVEVLLGLDGRPQLETTSGEPKVHCEARLTTELEPAEVRSRLDQVLPRDEEDDASQAATSGWYIVRETEMIEDAIIATVKLLDGELGTAADSVVRHQKILDVVRSALGDLRLVTESRVPFSRGVALMREEDLASTFEEAVDDRHAYLDDDYLDDEDEAEEEAAGSSPELEAAIDEMLQRFEQSWLDMPLAALGGLTPPSAGSRRPRRAHAAPGFHRAWAPSRPAHLAGRDGRQAAGDLQRRQASRRAGLELARPVETAASALTPQAGR